MISLGYWPIRGRGQIPRYLFEYLNVEYNDKKYTDREEWFKKDKQGLGLDFPNLPYLIDNEDNVKLTESQAIPRYICAKWKPELLGSTLQEKGRVEMFMNVQLSMLQELAGVLFDKANFEKKKDDAFKKADTSLQMIEKAYGGKKYLLGDNISLADFSLYEFMEVVYLVEPKAREHYQNIADFRQRFDQIPQIAEYKKSSRWIEMLFPPGTVAVNNV